LFADQRQAFLKRFAGGAQRPFDRRGAGRFNGGLGCFCVKEFILV